MSTTAVVTNSLLGTFDPNVIDGGAATILKNANNDDPEALARLAQLPTFKVQADTNTNDTLTVMDLNTLGVTFPLDYVRNLRIRTWARGVSPNNGSTGGGFAFAEGVFPILGYTATTPNVQPAGTSAVPTDDQRFVCRTPLTTTATTPVYVSAVPVVSANNHVVVRVTGPTAGVDLRWVVEVEIGALHLVPSALT